MSEEVCEWRLCSFFGGDWYITGCQFKRDKIPDDNICPYCKKPIKIVEEE